MFFADRFLQLALKVEEKNLVINDKLDEDICKEQQQKKKNLSNNKKEKSFHFRMSDNFCFSSFFLIFI